MTRPVVMAQDVSFRYVGADQDVIHGFTLAVQGGEMVGVTGPSGCGKSTLLFLLGLFVRPTAGSVRIDGVDTTRLGDGTRSQLRAHRIGLVFQDAILDDSLTVAENVIEGALYAGASHRTASREAAMLLERYGIAGLASTTPNRISGGQAQRVALCRALLHHPALLLADEPTGNLDADSASTVLAGLREAATAGTAVLIVTHDLRVALGCDRSLTLV